MVEELKLYDFQEPYIHEVRLAKRRHQHVLLQAATGWGKTTGVTHMLGLSYQKGHSCNIYVHLVELVDQIAERLERYGIPFSYVASGYPRGDEKIRLCLTKTFIRRIGEERPPRWSYSDECQHIEANEWQLIRSFAPDCKDLGGSATPIRLDKKPLRNSYSYMVKTQQIKELISLGQLVPPVVYAPPNNIDLSAYGRNSDGEVNLQSQALEYEKKQITGDVIKHYESVCPDVPFVVFVPTLKFGADVAERFTAAGYPTKVISSKLTKFERRSMIKGFVNGSIRGLVNVNLITEGVDIPSIGCVIWLRHTESLNIWMQGNGRSLRSDKANGKTCAYILDHVGNTYLHGLPDADREWSLDYELPIRKKKGSRSLPLKRCEACFAIWESGNICPQCGTALEQKEREIITVAGQLVLLSDETRVQEIIKKEALKRKIKDSMRYCKKIGRAHV